MNQDIPQEIIDAAINDRDVRTAIVKEKHLLFFAIYLGHYIKYNSAPFHNELLSLTEDSTQMNVIVAFRGSGKSTIMTLSYPLWAICGKLQKKFVVIFAQTETQAKQYLKNIKEELESNSLLRQDLGPFREEFDNEWNSKTLVIENYDARIMIASSEQSIRGIRHKEHRPDLIILDDVEDIQSVKTAEGRKKTFNWVTGDVIPLGDKNTKYVFIGNLLHNDSFLVNLKEKIEKKEIDGIYKFYPLLNEKGDIIWPGKYPTEQSIQEERKKVLDEVAWQREYLLRIIPDDYVVIQKEWIHYYDVLPNTDYPKNKYFLTSLGVDLAISESSQSDYTAIVTAKLFEIDGETKIYILPNPTNSKLNFPSQKKMIWETYNSTLGHRNDSFIFIESVGYQEAMVQDMKNSEFIKGTVIGCRNKLSKRERLATLSQAIYDGKILFPSSGAEQLINQIVNFGIEKHDDLVDAFYYAVSGAFEKNRTMVRVGTTDIFKLRM